MRFGVNLPQWGPTATRQGVLQVAAAAEASGFDSAWVGDHFIWPRTIESPYPFADTPPVDPTAGFLEALTLLSVVAGATKTLRLGVGTLVLPMRHPLVAAKTIATLDVLSDGRVEIAVGAGWMREEFEVIGLPFDSRGPRMEESLAIMRDAWATGWVKRDEGEFVFREVACLPLPTQVGGPPVWVGGMTKVAMRRAARADGWYSVGFDPDAIRAGRDFVRAEAERLGRDPRTVQTSAVISFERESARLVDKLGILSDIGIDQVVFGAFGSTTAPLIAAMEASEPARRELASPTAGAL